MFEDFSLRVTWRFVALSFLGGLLNVQESCCTSGYSSSVSNEQYGSLIVFIT